MPDLPLHFKELNLFPRVIFAVGGILFVYSLIGKDWPLTFFGLGVALFGMGYNFAFEVVLNRHKTVEGREKTEYHSLIFHAVLSFLLSAASFGFFWLIYHH